MKMIDFGLEYKGKCKVLMNILVTGSAGLVGKALTKTLSSNHRIIGLSRNDPSDIHADILKLTDQEITGILEKYGVDMIIHCAADREASTAQGFYLNSYGMQKLAMHPLGRKKRHVLLGSIAEYGSVPGPETSHAEYAASPDSYYGASKLLQTALAYFDKERHGTDIQVVQPCSIISPDAKSQSFMGHIIEQAMKGESAVISLDNDMKTQDFLDMRDLCSAIALIIREPAKRFSYEVGNGSATSFREILGVLFEILRAHGKPIPAIHVANHTMACRAIADTMPLRQDYDWTPQYGLKESLEWCLREKGYLSAS